MKRRTLIKAGSMAALGLGFGGCAAKRPRSPATPLAPRRLVNLVPVQASWERVMHTTVGLRPHRPPGFVVKPEQCDDKTIIQTMGTVGRATLSGGATD
jgi:hypothetical protein